MKNCDEMVNSLLERREQYAAKQKRKRRALTRTITSMCCVCLVTLLGFGMWRGGFFNITPPTQTIEDAVYPGVKDAFDESKGEPAENPTVNNKIIVHRIDGLSSDRYKLDVDLAANDFVVMDRVQLNEYYGLNVFPMVPGDLKEWEDQQFGVYKKDGGFGDVYWDATVLNYSNEDFSRAVNVELQKDALPLCDYAFFHTIEEKSIINKIEVAIGRSDEGYYYAQFMYQNVGFQIIADGLTQDEFVAVISSLIQ